MDETKKQQLIDALRNDTGAAFGVFPQMQARRGNQDREAAKNIPVDLGRGFVSGVVGMPGDLESLFRDKTFFPTSEQIAQKLPFKSETPLGNAVEKLGQFGGQMYNGPLSAPRSVSALSSALRRGGEDFVKAAGGGVSRMVPADFVKDYTHRPMTVEQGAAPLHDLLSAFDDTIYSPAAIRNYGTGDKFIDKQVLNTFNSVRGNPNAEVNAYRAIPLEDTQNALRHGDWVTVSKDYAKIHGEGPLGGKYKIIEQKVPASHLTTNADSILEQGYYPTK